MPDLLLFRGFCDASTYALIAFHVPGESLLNGLVHCPRWIHLQRQPYPEHSAYTAFAGWPHYAR
jgi:hypothetical protein